MTNNFPTVVVDGFLQNPEAVVAFAETLTYEADPNSRWPGVRSNHLAQVAPDFFNFVCKRFFALFFNYSADEVTWEVDMRFQKIPSEYGSGWIHADPCLITGLVYLNKDEAIGAGTSIYRLKKDTIATDMDKHLQDKVALFSGKKTFLEVENNFLEHNSKFEETLSVGAVFNRLVAFESEVFHSAQNFSVPSGERLTLIAFVDKLGHRGSPMHRVRTGNT